MPEAAEPPVEPEAWRRALRGILSEEEIEDFLPPAEGSEEGFWVSFAPGPNPVVLALSVVSDGFLAWLKRGPVSDRTLRVIERLRALPEEEALRRIRD